MTTKSQTAPATSQTALILEHLETGKPITPSEALRLYGCMRLGARIHDLRAGGHSITGTRVRLRNGKHVARYSMP